MVRNGQIAEICPLPAHRPWLKPWASSPLGGAWESVPTRAPGRRENGVEASPQARPPDGSPRPTREGEEHGCRPQQVIPLLPEGQERAGGPHDDEAQAEDGNGCGRDAVLCGTREGGDAGTSEGASSPAPFVTTACAAARLVTAPHSTVPFSQVRKLRSERLNHSFRVAQWLRGGTRTCTRPNSFSQVRHQTEVPPSRGRGLGRKREICGWRPFWSRNLPPSVRAEGGTQAGVVCPGTDQQPLEG